MARCVFLLFAFSWPDFLNAARVQAMRQTAKVGSQDQPKESSIGGGQSIALGDHTALASEHDSVWSLLHPVGGGGSLLEAHAQVALELHAATPQVHFHDEIEDEKHPMPAHVPSRWQSFKRVFGIATLIACSMAVVYSAVHWLHHLQGQMLSLIVCGIYVAFSVTIDVSIAVQKSDATRSTIGTFMFDPTCAVMLAEASKLTVSIALYVRSVLMANWQKEVPSSTTDSLKASLKDSGISFVDVKWLFIPAALFTLNNLLVYKAISGNDMAAFGVFRDTVIMFTAALWCFVFKTPLGHSRLVGIFIIFSGLALNRAGVLAGGIPWSWSFLWVLFMSMSNSLASVSNEFALKRSQGLDINLQNSVLYAAGVLCCALVVLITDTQRFLCPSTFFSGFTHSTLFTVFVQSVAGLLVSRILKYADAVTKTVASCLRGPLVVLVAPMFVVSPQDLFTNVSALVVATGCFTYLSAGKLEVANPNATQAQAHTMQAKLTGNKMDAS